MHVDGLVYAFFGLAAVIIIAAATIWRRFKSFLVEELEAKLVTPLSQRLTILEEKEEKLEIKLNEIENRHQDSQTGIQQKFETIIRDVADLKGRLEGMLGKFDLYLKIGDKYGKER